MVVVIEVHELVNLKLIIININNILDLINKYICKMLYIIFYVTKYRAISI